MEPQSMSRVGSLPLVCLETASPALGTALLRTASDLLLTAHLLGMEGPPIQCSPPSAPSLLVAVGRPRPASHCRRLPP